MKKIAVLFLGLVISNVNYACRLADSSKKYPNKVIEVTYLAHCTDCKGKVRGAGERKQCIGDLIINGKQERLYLIDFECKGPQRSLTVSKPTHPCHSQIVEVLIDSLK